MSRRFSQEDEIFILDNFPQYGPGYCAEILGRGSDAVGEKAKRMGLRASADRFKHPSMCKNFKLSILEEPTKELAYFMGFLWADGYVLKKIDKNGIQHHKVNFEIASEDFDDIHSVFKGFSTWSVSKRKRRESWRETSSATINNKFLCEFLISLGYCDKHSSFERVFEYLSPSKLIDYFILGLFDGDGYTDFHHVIQICAPITFD